MHQRRESSKETVPSSSAASFSARFRSFCLFFFSWRFFAAAEVLPGEDAEDAASVDTSGTSCGTATSRLVGGGLPRVTIATKKRMLRGTVRWPSGGKVYAERQRNRERERRLLLMGTSLGRTPSRPAQAAESGVPLHSVGFDAVTSAFSLFFASWDLGSSHLSKLSFRA